ncbi:MULTISPECIES: YgdB family protein [Buttiauxella]|uniref:YgdB family protein n=1 Tax=Buttiauxella TaxID=82976 RepID=UPI001060DB0B|nr:MULTISPECIES: YgdB family protein [Buttiauxella]TDN47467.1 uncharacterized protein DUF2509 [Buttiauxella sp. JUb87]UNK62194.1 YgdB family protein [Buttiauxella ferragutiae]
MNKRFERGNVTLGFVLLLFALGMLILSGLQQQLSHQKFLVASEVGFLKQYASAVSAQSWGSQLSWQPQQSWHCQQQTENGWKACVRMQEKNEAVMAAFGIVSGQKTPLILWEWGILVNSRWSAVPHGWLDFCPFDEVTRCQLPQ